MIENEFKPKIDVSGIEGIYNASKLDFDELKKNPILKPISDINQVYINFELIINKALYDYQKDENQINDMIKLNPKYSETMLMARVQSLKNSMIQIIHSQDIQKDNLIRAINDIIKIVKKEYGLLESEESEENKPKKEISKDTQTPKIVNKEGIEPEKASFHSTLLNKNIPTPKGEEGIPVRKE